MGLVADEGDSKWSGLMITCDQPAVPEVRSFMPIFSLTDKPNADSIVDTLRGFNRHYAQLTGGELWPVDYWLGPTAL